MLTVPAQSFCAPARARSIAALRSMPGVCGVLGSSAWPGMTRTPSCFHFGARSRSELAFMSLLSSALITPGPTRASSLLPPPRRARKSFGLFRGAEQRLGLVDAFLLLEFGVGIGDDAGASLDVHHAVLDQRRAQHDAAVELARGGEIAHRPGIEPALVGFELVDDLHRPYLGRARDGAGREARRQRVERVVFSIELAFDVRNDMHHLAEALDGELVSHLDGGRARDAADVVTPEIE